MVSFLFVPYIIGRLGIIIWSQIFQLSEIDLRLIKKVVCILMTLEKCNLDIECNSSAHVVEFNRIHLSSGHSYNSQDTSFKIDCPATLFIRLHTWSILG